MASRLLKAWVRTVEAIKGAGRIEERSMLVLTMLVGFALVAWVYSWILVLMLEDNEAPGNQKRKGSSRQIPRHARSRREFLRGVEVAYA